MNTTTRFTKEPFNGGQHVFHFACPFTVNWYVVTYAADCISKHEEASSKPICTGHGRFRTHYQQVTPFLILNDSYTGVALLNKTNIANSQLSLLGQNVNRASRLGQIRW
jgi:hypothetical protein